MVKEERAVEPAERLLALDANVVVTARTLLLPINSLSECEHKWLSDGLLQLLA